MAKTFKEAFKGIRQRLSEEITVNDTLLNYLRQVGLLHKENVDEIKAKMDSRGAIPAATMLLDHLERSDDEKLPLFRQALKEFNQLNAVRLLGQEEAAAQPPANQQAPNAAQANQGQIRSVDAEQQTAN